MKSTGKFAAPVPLSLATTLLLGALLAGCMVQPETRLTAAPQLTAAESFIDAFYSFDPDRLRGAMSTAPVSLPKMLYYQGWAKGGNYIVLDRKPCRFEKAEEVRCDITVKDDLISALGTSYDVTDSFHLTFKDRRIISVRNTSNDPPEFEQAQQWLLRERPELLTGPCLGFFAGGPTPQDCVRAFVKGFADFTSRRRR